ncbi:MAG: hypothetical protein GX573_08875 [Chloroflexi bacterium]|nr:hypothetical protein [Chloroflexota bacterium]
MLTGTPVKKMMNMPKLGTGQKQPEPEIIDYVPADTERRWSGRFAMLILTLVVVLQASLLVLVWNLREDVAKLQQAQGQGVALNPLPSATIASPTLTPSASPTPPPTTLQPSSTPSVPITVPPDMCRGEISQDGVAMMSSPASDTGIRKETLNEGHPVGVAQRSSDLNWFHVFYSDHTSHSGWVPALFVMLDESCTVLPTAVP